MNYSDPGVWENYDDHLRRNLVEHGPVQVEDFNFPRNNDHRKLSTIHYKRRLTNGEYVHRQWLQYSVSKDLVFCFPCKLFSTTNRGSTLCNNGSNDWKNMSVKYYSYTANKQVMKKAVIIWQVSKCGKN